MQRILIAITLFVSSLMSSFASDVKVAPGEWKTMFSYNNVSAIEVSSQYVFLQTSPMLSYFDKRYQELNVIDKYNSGMYDGTVAKIKCIDKLGLLMICYTDLTIEFYDFSKGKIVFTDFSIKLKDIVGKTINSIDVTDDGSFAYLSTDFGIVKYNINKKEVSESYYLGDEGTYMSIKSVVLLNDSIFAYASNGQILCASAENKMLVNNKNWKEFPLPSSNIITLSEHAGKLVAATGSELSCFDNSKWNGITPAMGRPREMFSHEGTLLCKRGVSFTLYKKGSFEETRFEIDRDNYQHYVYDESSNTLWCIADNCLYAIIDGKVSNVYSMVEGPYQNTYSKVCKFDDRLILVGNEGYSSPAIVSIYENDVWTNITPSVLGEDFNAQYDFFTSVDIVADPKDKSKYYVPTWRGVFVIKDGKVIEKYDQNNSSLLIYVNGANDQKTLVDCAWMDDMGNLFVANIQASDLIHVLSPDGKWTALKHNSLLSLRAARRHLRTKKGFDVITCTPDSKCILFLDTKGTPTNSYDDKAVKMSSLSFSDGVSSNSISPGAFYDVVEDLNGDIWLGIDQGVVYFKSKTVSAVSETMNEVVRPKITREDDNRFADYLLSTDHVMSIAVDGQNRKWLGTKDNGLYLVSQDGTEIIEHYTSEDSRLPSNTINSLCYDGKTGALYVLTNQGLCVFGTDASEGKEDYEEVTVFPNPVRPDYDGQVVVQGLMEDSNVRITDSKGNMIENGMSNGGTYCWSARRKDGSRVATGVYNIFVTTQDGTSYKHLKVAVVK